MKVGDMVKVVSICDDEGDNRFVGRVGRIVKRGLGQAGVGDSYTDPFWTVNVVGLGKDGFWTEELKFLAE